MVTPEVVRNKAFSPVSLPVLSSWLERYPNRAVAGFLLDGFRSGFRLPIGSGVVVSSPRNLRSARDFPSVVRQKVDAEVLLGRMCGPFGTQPLPDLCISPVGVVPKKAPGKFRLIQHLSYPRGRSVNDAIPRELCRVSYQLFDEALDMIRSFGPGAMLAKMDIESAFRLLPLHPESFRFMGFQLQGQFFVDLCLPMGCAISCAYFEAFSSFLHWCIAEVSGQTGIAHYLDDFLFVGARDDSACSDLLAVATALFSSLGVPVAHDKTEGPCSCLTYLGIEVDTGAGCCRLPADKVARLLSQIDVCLGRDRVRLQVVQSLLGSLNFACRVIPMGRVFCRKLERATAGVTKPHHTVRLSSEIKGDLKVWASFLRDFNLERIWSSAPQPNGLLQLFTDAAGSTGFGAFFQGAWCVAAWPPEWRNCGYTSNLLLLELFPIIVAVELWAGSLANRVIVFWCDNLGVVQAINNQRCCSPPALRLLRHLVLRCLLFNISFTARHVPGVDNQVADALSRFDFVRFRALCPGASATGLPCPPHVWQIVDQA